MNRGFNVLCLSLATAFWGLSIVSQAVGNRYMQPFTFNAVRFVISVAALVPALIVFRSLRDFAAQKHDLLRGGVLCGAALFFCINLQQAALQYVPAGNAIFICSLYMVLVPVVKYLTGTHGSPALWLAVALACAGMWLLSAAGGLSLSFGEGLCLACAAGYTCHILLLERYAPAVDCFALTTVQFAVVAALSALGMTLLESPDWNAVLSGWRPLLYSGVISGSVAYSLQALGQRGYDASAASLILSMETVFGAVGAWLILGEAMNSREISGCVLVLIAVLLTQLPARKIA